MDMELSDEGEMDHIPCDSTVYCYMGWGVAMKHIHVQMRLARNMADALLEGTSSTSSGEMWGYPMGVSSHSSSKMPTICLALAM